MDNMLYYTGLFFLVIAVSLDGFGVGLTYGMRNIKVPPLPLLIIMLCSGTVVFASMTIGNMLIGYISESAAESVGGIILIATGLFSLFNVLRGNQEKGQAHSVNERPIRHFTTVMTKPDQADLDRSGTLSTGEAWLLGIASALVAFGAGIAASFIGYAAAMTSVFIACMSGLFVFGGVKTGVFLSKYSFLQNFSFLPPLLLIGLGVINLI